MPVLGRVCTKSSSICGDRTGILLVAYGYEVNDRTRSKRPTVYEKRAPSHHFGLLSSEKDVDGELAAPTTWSAVMKRAPDRLAGAVSPFGICFTSLGI